MRKYAYGSGLVQKNMRTRVCIVVVVCACVCVCVNLYRTYVQPRIRNSHYNHPAGTFVSMRLDIVGLGQYTSANILQQCKTAS